ncbi:hypothetical protein [Undibacterium sp. TJN19]|uniref:hypothetical protein n=1 Tax=Undibacterium sp. TJN19 TaxID=3413055 RepID=UPI003BF2E40F
MASPGKKSFPLRIDPVLWNEIERMAAQELRSANAQVEYLLRQALQQRGRHVPPPGQQDARDNDSDSEVPDQKA